MTTFTYRYLTNVTLDERGHPSGGMARFSDEPEEVALPTDTFIVGWEGNVDVGSLDPRAAADAVYALHNADDRPSGKVTRSMSTGDVVVLEWRQDGLAMRAALACAPIGWVEIYEPTRFDLRSFAEIMGSAKV